MKITNKYNLPQALVDLVKDSQFGYKSDSYGATTILNPTRSILLSKRHYDEMEVDVSECVNQVLGTATHSLIEKFDKTGYAEIFLKQEIKDGYYLTGKCDLYDPVNFEIIDWKTANVWKVKFSDFDDYKKQGLIYAWLISKQNKFVKRIKFNMLLKDWTAREKRLADLKGDFYPESQVYTWSYDVSTQDLLDIELFINNKFDELIAQDKLTDDELMDCGKFDTWYTGDKYAVYKNEGDSKAQRVFDTIEEATLYMQAKNCNFMQHRIGEYRKCQDYCSCCKFCKYYKERKAN